MPLVGLALVGFAIAAYLAAFQIGLVSSVWEPFFGDGSRRILTSGVSRVLPVPDAALGAFGYLLDAVTGLIGGRDRWRSMPWVVVLFGIDSPWPAALDDGLSDAERSPHMASWTPRPHVARRG